jgi:hypothetical protein
LFSAGRKIPARLLQLHNGGQGLGIGRVEGKDEWGECLKYGMTKT